MVQFACPWIVIVLRERSFGVTVGCRAFAAVPCRIGGQDKYYAIESCGKYYAALKPGPRQLCSLMHRPDTDFAVVYLL